MNGSQPKQLRDIAAAYQAGQIGRRDFILRAGAILGGVALAERYLSSLGLTGAGVARAQEATPPPPAASDNSVTVSPDDPSIRTQMVEFSSLEPKPVPIMGYLARPASAAPAPGVVIVHDNQVLSEHMQDVARRYAKEGFVALLPDLLSREGGTASIDPSQISPMLFRVDNERHISDIMAAGNYIRTLSGVRGPGYGLTGFCFGGGIAWLTLPRDPNIMAAVPFYGTFNPTTEEASTIQAKVLGIWAELDYENTARLTTLLPGLQEGRVRHEMVVYHNTQHAFFGDNRGPRYNAEAAADAWVRTINWFRMHMEGGAA